MYEGGERCFPDILLAEYECSRLTLSEVKGSILDVDWY